MFDIQKLYILVVMKDEFIYELQKFVLLAVTKTISLHLSELQELYFIAVIKLSLCLRYRNCIF